MVNETRVKLAEMYLRKAENLLSETKTQSMWEWLEGPGYDALRAKIATKVQREMGFSARDMNKLTAKDSKELLRLLMKYMKEEIGKKYPPSWFSGEVRDYVYDDMQMMIAAGNDDEEGDIWGTM
jgi:predicted metalloendopeptidase